MKHLIPSVTRFSNLSRPRCSSFVFTFLLLLSLGTSPTFAQQTTAPRVATPSSNLPVPAGRTVKPTVYATPNAATPPATAADDVVPLPALNAPVVVPRQGVLIETAAGRAVMEQAGDTEFNPASAVKLATALVALRSLGAKNRFSTALMTNGIYDSATGTIAGDLIVVGRDPSFRDEHAVEIARELNRIGISVITGDLIVTPTFTMNFSASPLSSGNRFYDTLDATRRPTSAARAWTQARFAAGETQTLAHVPSVAVMGAVYVSNVPPNSRQLMLHKSSPLVDVLKTMLCYSNNFMAERLGDMLGGSTGVENFLIDKLGIDPDEARLASTSGLGVNRMTPRGMMKVYRALVAELASDDLTTADILPVAGIDPGTLKKRYEATLGRGSIIAKTGTLVRSDGGTSALVGEALAANGERLYFVIFNRGGNVWRSRSQQDQIVLDQQLQRGGPRAIAYMPRSAVAVQLATAPANSGVRPASDEYEPNPQ